MPKSRTAEEHDLDEFVWRQGAEDSRAMDIRRRLARRRSYFTARKLS